MIRYKEKAGHASGLIPVNLLGELLINGDFLAFLAQAFELNGTVNKCEQGIILALADIGAGMNLRTALANENVPCQNELTIRTLGAETLGLAVAAVLGRTHTFFMSHLVTPPS